MKIYLASFLQPENFGPGDLIGIADTPSKPKTLTVKVQFLPFAPPKTLVDNYNKMRVEQPKEAGEMFVSSYKAQLEKFVEELQQDAQIENKSMTDLLPFKDGDTLASWERAEYTNFRRILAPYLEKIGYEVSLK